MSAMVSIEVAQAHLAELIGRMAPGEELIITKGYRTVGKLIAPPSTTPGMTAAISQSSASGRGLKGCR